MTKLDVVKVVSLQTNDCEFFYSSAPISYVYI